MIRFTPKRGRWAAAGVLAAVAAGGAASIAAATSGSGGSPSGSGTVTVKVTRPDGTTRTRPRHQVACSVKGGDYMLRFERGRARRHNVATLAVSGYHGPGSYQGTLRVIARGPFLRLSRTIHLPVTITDSGGQATVSRTLPGKIHPTLKGKTVSATASWTCTP